MNYREYTEVAQKECLERYGAFFAFSKEQFNEKADPRKNYTELSYGLIVPAENAKELISKLVEISSKSRDLRLAQNTPEQIIKQELGNHECQIAGTDKDAREALCEYDFTDKQFADAWNSFWDECIKNDSF